MKVIGKRVHVIPPTKQNPRNGEGDFVRLPDGREHLQTAGAMTYTTEA